MNELFKSRPFVPPATATDHRVAPAERRNLRDEGRQADASLAIEALRATAEQKALFAWFDAEGIPPDERERILIERAKKRAPRS